MNILIAGVGGQGTVLLARLIADMALAHGAVVRGSETIGMAQRGGSVVSHVRIGEMAYSPLIPAGEADVLLAFEPREAIRALGYFRPGGALAVCDRQLAGAVPAALRAARAPQGRDGSRSGAGEPPPPPSPPLEVLKARVSNITVLSFDKVLQSCGNTKPLNMALLGVAIAAGLLPFTLDNAKSALRGRVPVRFWELNETALTCAAD
ncbi:MAG: 2-oxoacid:acceptor oxidoreductase family protein [Oscillospiraceae bacterium]|nr:2-oxoacid:acceptor oxidoreductase family protein [Oscillospiraceae bacterium]